MAKKILFVFLAGILLSACGRSSTSVFSPVPTTVPTQIPGTIHLADLEWANFSSPSVGLSFKYPSSWQIKDQASASVKLVSSASSTAASLMVSKLTKAVTATSSANYDINGLPAVLTITPIDANTEQQNLAITLGKDNYQLIYRYPVNDSDLKALPSTIFQSLTFISPTAYTCASTPVDCSLITNAKSVYCSIGYLVWSQNNCSPN